MSENYQLLENIPYKSQYSGEDIDGLVEGLKALREIIGNYSSNSTEARTIKKYLEDLQDALGSWSANIDVNIQVRPYVESLKEMIDNIEQTSNNSSNKVDKFEKDIEDINTNITSLNDKIGNTNEIEKNTIVAAIIDTNSKINQINKESLVAHSDRLKTLEDWKKELSIGQGDAAIIGKNLTDWGLNISNTNLNQIIKESPIKENTGGLPGYIISLKNNQNEIKSSLQEQINNNANDISTLNKLFHIQVIDYNSTIISQ